MKSKLTYKEFKEMEDHHSTGSLYKVCEVCTDGYRPELRIYKKKGWKGKRIVGNWIASKHCDKCSNIISKKQKEEREDYRKQIMIKQILYLKENKPKIYKKLIYKENMYK